MEELIEFQLNFMLLYLSQIWQVLSFMEIVQSLVRRCQSELRYSWTPWDPRGRDVMGMSQLQENFQWDFGLSWTLGQKKSSYINFYCMELVVRRGR